MLDTSAGFRLARSKINFVECRDAETIEQDGWRVESNTLRRVIVMQIENSIIAPVRPRKYAAPKFRAPSAAIYPGHRMLEFFDAFSGQRPEFLEIEVRNGFNIEISAGDSRQLDLHPFDDPGQAEAADRRLHQAAVIIRRDYASGAVTAQKPQGFDMTAE